MAAEEEGPNPPTEQSSTNGATGAQVGTNNAGRMATVPPPSPNQCSCCPHGFYVVLPAILSTFGWLVRLSQDGCDYSRLTGPIVAELTSNPRIPFLDVGFNQYRVPTEDNGEWYSDYRFGCYEYNSDVVNIDSVWTFAKVMGFLSLVFGGGGALFLWFSSCFLFSKSTWRWAGYELLLATVFQALTFSWFGTEMCHGNDNQNACTLYYGSKADFLTLSCWLVSSAFVFAKYPSPKSGNERNNESPPVPSELEMAETATPADLSMEQQHESSNDALTTAENAPTIPEIS
ncbi:hypothetical protein HJC23_012574 [Cyclotella cryptica]|uniref:Uncharacterized protein n=1 Tax=Cyclotella cryptica TaxID=29204 RepID=A0ABD3NWW9_9STRA